MLRALFFILLCSAASSCIRSGVASLPALKKQHPYSSIEGVSGKFISPGDSGPELVRFKIEQTSEGLIFQGSGGPVPLKLKRAHVRREGEEGFLYEFDVEGAPAADIFVGSTKFRFKALNGVISFSGSLDPDSFKGELKAPIQMHPYDEIISVKGTFFDRQTSNREYNLDLERGIIQIPDVEDIQVTLISNARTMLDEQGFLYNFTDSMGYKGIIFVGSSFIYARFDEFDEFYIGTIDEIIGQNN